MYYRIYRFGVFISDDFLNEIKPSVTMSFFVFAIISEIIIWISIWQGHLIQILPFKIFVPLIFILLWLIDYYLFNRKDKWKDEAKKFEKFSQGKKRIWDLLVILIVLLVVVSFFYSINASGRIGK